MAFTGITATEDHIDEKMGAEVDTDFTDTMKTQELLMAESILNAVTEFNWSDWYATSPNVDIKYIVTDTTASIVAIEGIKYNMSTYESRDEAESMIVVLRDKVLRNIGILRDKNVQTFILKIS